MPTTGATRRSTPPMRRRVRRPVVVGEVCTSDIADDIPLGSGQRACELSRAYPWPVTRLLPRLGGWCARHPLVVVGLWLAFAAATTSLAATAGGRLSQG